jgi:hypothetical protein
MLVAYMNGFIIFLKLLSVFLFKLFLFNILYLKILGLVICLLGIYILRTYPRTLQGKLSQSQLSDIKFNKVLTYALKTTWDHIWNIIVLFLYIIILFFGFIWLRFLNKDNTIDLFEIYAKVQEVFAILSITMTIVNILLFLFFFILYIMLLNRISKYFKFHVIKRHLYLSQPNSFETYGSNIMDLDKVNIYAFSNLIRKFIDYNKKRKYANYALLSWEERVSIVRYTEVEHKLFIWSEIIINKIHYIVLVLVVIYDLYFNNLVLTHMFACLPWVYLYEMYIRISRFTHDLWGPFDRHLHEFLYLPITYISARKEKIFEQEFSFPEEVYFGDKLQDMERFSEIVNIYVSNDFVFGCKADGWRSKYKTW